MEENVRSKLEAYRRGKKSLTEERPKNINSNDESDTTTETEDKESFSKSEITKTPWYLTVLKILLWLLLWGFFIEVEFGLVYFISSGLVFIVLSLRGGSNKRRPNELSAYSVFNKNFEAIDGTLSAEQLERELRYGPNSVK